MPIIFFTRFLYYWLIRVIGNIYWIDVEVLCLSLCSNFVFEMSVYCFFIFILFLLIYINSLFMFVLMYIFEIISIVNITTWVLIFYSLRVITLFWYVIKVRMWYRYKAFCPLHMIGCKINVIIIGSKILLYTGPFTFDTQNSCLVHLEW